eukprot:Awhi_evm1s910
MNAVIARSPAYFKSKKECSCMCSGRANNNKNYSGANLRNMNIIIRKSSSTNEDIIEVAVPEAGEPKLQICSNNIVDESFERRIKNSRLKS